ncbi:MAG TPA: peptide chain release factor 1, partial [archaeon]|nr:peptide chain release factor 1 [archaeon]
MDDIKRKELEALVKTLEGVRGRHTELVTVYVPAGFELSKVVQQLRNEQGTAENIKSKATRKAVTGSLERILQHLKNFKGTPPNGLAVFCGNVGGEGAESLELWSLEPPEPLRQRLYWCGQTFVLDPLKELVREKEVYGLILVDKGDAAIGLLVGKRVKLLKQFDSLVLGKTRKGGWCVHEDTLLPMADGK